MLKLLFKPVIFEDDINNNKTNLFRILLIESSV